MNTPKGMKEAAALVQAQQAAVDQATAKLEQLHKALIARYSLHGIGSAVQGRTLNGVYCVFEVTHIDVNVDAMKVEFVYTGLVLNKNGIPTRTRAMQSVIIQLVNP